MRAKIFEEKRIEIIFLIGLFIFFTMWAVIQPFNVSPDEQMRYLIPQYIYNHGTLPHGGDIEIRNEMWGNSYGFTPILSYIFSACLMKIASIFSTDATVLLIAARMVSVIFGVGTVWMTIKISKKIFSKDYCWVFIFLVAMLPQAIFITSYVNNDSMAMFSTAWIVYIWIKGMETKWDYKTCLSLGVSIALCSQSYYYAYGFILCSIVFFCISILMFSEKKWDIKTLIKKGLLVSMIVVILAGWWFVRNYFLYNGDIIGMKTCDLYGERYAVDAWKPSNRATYLKRNIPVWDMLFRDGWLKGVYRSFIGRFGYMTIPLFTWIYTIYDIIFVGAFIGFIPSFKNMFIEGKDTRWRELRLFNWVMLLSAIIPTLLSIYYSYTSDYQPQGRYSLMMLVPMMYFVTSGIQWILDKIFKTYFYKKLILILLCMLVTCLAIISYVFVFAPNYISYFRQTFLT